MPKRKKSREEEPLEAASTRPFWSGTITFGLVSIPVNLFPTSRTARPSLRMIGPDGTPLSRRYYSQKSGRELDDTEMVRGYEIDEGKYVTVTDEELEGLEPKKSRDIDLRLFVKKDDIDPVYFEHAYFLAPAGGSVKAYQLLAETMQRHSRAGLATFVMRGKEYLVAIVSEHGILRAETLRFTDEVRLPQNIGLPKPGRVSPAHVRKLQRLIRRKSAANISREELRDEQTERLLKLVKSKEAHNTDVVESEAVGQRPTKVVDLMEVLKKSLRQKRTA